MKRVLFIGKDPNVCQDVSGTLSGLGYAVDIAHDSNMGLSLAQRREYSHILVDDEVNGEGGIRLFEQLKATQRSAIGVLLTATANLNTVFSAVSAGMRRVLATPVDYAQLLPLLNLTGKATSPAEPESLHESDIAVLSLYDIRERLSDSELISLIRSVEYPFAGKERLEHFDRDTLERVVHLVCRWCRQRESAVPALVSEGCC